MATTTLFDPAQAGVLALAGATQFSEAGIVSRTVLDQDGVRVTLFAFAAGQQLTEHATPARALIQVLGGTAEFTVAGVRHTLHAGDLLHLPPGAPHAVQAPEAFSMLLTLVRRPAAPAR